MKKLCFLSGVICSALLLCTFSAQATERTGKELFVSCSTCHTPSKRDLVGKNEAYLLDKFAYYQKSNYKAMKTLFDAMSETEKTTLAKYIQNLK